MREFCQRECRQLGMLATTYKSDINNRWVFFAPLFHFTCRCSMLDNFIISSSERHHHHVAIVAFTFEFAQWGGKSAKRAFGGKCNRRKRRFYITIVSGNLLDKLKNKRGKWTAGKMHDENLSIV